MSTGLRIGRYELGERVGTGGFGVVYHARDTELGRELAIKILRPEYQTQPDVIARFLKEARAAAKIDHPGIITVFECGTISGSGTAQDGNAYIAMELLRGQSLTQHLEQRGRLAATEAILIARQVAGALAVAHAAGIVHRDLKPDNVFLLPDSLVTGGYRIKILDFGVAKLAEPKEVGVNTHSQMMLGTPKYMSPEQARSARAVDQRTDIYTLGCMLYEMVTGQAPYEGPGAIDMIIQHTTAPIPSPRAIVNGLPESLDRLIRRMLEKEPADRPDSMTAIEQALEGIQGELGAPRAKPPTSPPRIPPTPSRPAPRQSPLPSGLTPTPAVTLSTIRPRKPTPGPPPIPATPARAPARPTPGIVPVRPTPAPADSASYSLEEAPTETAPARPAPVAQVRRESSRRWVVIVAGIAAAAAGAVVAFVALSSTPAEPPPAPREQATAPSSTVDVAKLEAECRSLERTEFWKELKVCSDQLKPHKPDVAAALWKKADDEAANEKKWIGLQRSLDVNDVAGARDLVKRIGPDSVYSVRAQKLLDEALAQ